jgi:hypothetical protein
MVSDESGKSSVFVIEGPFTMVSHWGDIDISIGGTDFVDWLMETAAMGRGAEVSHLRHGTWSCRGVKVRIALELLED